MDIQITEAVGKLSRRKFRLFKLYFNIVHRAGVKYQYADPLSRHETDMGDTKIMGDHIQVMKISDEKHTRNGNYEQAADEKDLENYWEMKHRAYRTKRRSSY